MAPFTIIWDFDGTLLPSDPFDSEHTLLLENMNAVQERLPLVKRSVGKSIIFLDRKQWMGPAFKRFYIWVLSGTPTHRIKSTSERLARKISGKDRECFYELARDGHDLQIVSCGTYELIECVLEKAGIRGCFSHIEANRLFSKNGRIVGIERYIIDPMDKLKPLHRQHLDAGRTVAVGDGYTDLPLLDWAGFPVLLNRSRQEENYRPSCRYTEIASIPELLGLIHHLSAKQDVKPDSRNR